MGIDATFDQQVAAGMLPPAFPQKFKEVADFAALETIMAEVWSEALDEATLDAAIAFFGTEAGRKLVDAEIGVTLKLMEKLQPWAIETAMKTMAALGEQGMDEDGGGAAGDEAPEDEAPKTTKDATLALNEVAAIATLRNLATCQAHIQTAGKVDADQDGIGEYGTLLEMTGAAAVRSGFAEGVGGIGDFSKQGTKVNPPILSPKMAGVDATGVVRKGGYCYRVFLPDSAFPSGFTHETGPAEKVGLAGGTARVGVEMSETCWCAYAWPEKLGETGNRVFFVNHTGDVMQSANEAAKWAGEKAPPGNSAFLGDGITAPLAVGTRARDGEVWKVAN